MNADNIEVTQDVTMVYDESTGSGFEVVVTIAAITIDGTEHTVVVESSPSLHSDVSETLMKMARLQLIQQLKDQGVEIDEV